MPKFRYEAVREDGNRARGTVDAANLREATAVLVGQGLQLQQLKERTGLRHTEITSRKAKPAEVMQFSRQMAAFVRTGVPMLDALAVLREEMKDKVLRRVLEDVDAGLRRGDGFADAMAGHAKAFPPFYIGILRSAEVTGQLDVVLEQLAAYLERDLEARRKIRAALVYPALVLVMALVSIVVLTAFVLPRFADFFAEFDAKLPLSTRMLISFADWISNWGIFLGWGFVLALLGVLLGVRTEQGRYLRDRFFLRLPVVKGVVLFAVVERFCRILASMVKAGVPVPDAMEIAGDGAHNLVFKRRLTQAREQMLEGQGLARPISQTGLFPSAVTQMLRAGEDTGTLDEQLEAMARFYEKELEYKIKNVTSLFEPIVLVIVGIGVGFVAIALVSALYGIYNQVELK